MTDRGDARQPELPVQPKYPVLLWGGPSNMSRITVPRLSIDLISPMPSGGRYVCHDEMIGDCSVYVHEDEDTGSLAFRAVFYKEQARTLQENIQSLVRSVGGARNCKACKEPVYFMKNKLTGRSIGVTERGTDHYRMCPFKRV